MTIKIVTERPLSLTGDELRKYREAYERMCSYHVSPPDFETWCRQQKDATPGDAK